MTNAGTRFSDEARAELEAACGRTGATYTNVLMPAFACGILDPQCLWLHLTLELYRDSWDRNNFLEGLANAEARIANEEAEEHKAKR
jgi:hypothetical protein